MIIVHDTRDKIGKHQNVDDYLLENGHKIVRSKLFVGDVTKLNDQSVCIDLKSGLPEVCSNVVQGHDRFVRELVRAQEYGIKLIVLIEHSRNIRKLEDVIRWKNPRLKMSPLAVSGERLYKIMYSLAKKYGVEWQFCEKHKTGERIIEILGGEPHE